ncbi:MAG: glycosyltransferase [Lysobacterales bacterium]|nr:MAG: glycosyltransferase [Xanthomonadales bacterium]
MPNQIGNAPVVLVSESREGLAIARNAGWQAAAGDIIAFTDDDCYIAPDFIDSVARAFSKSPEVGMIGGRILLHDPSDQPITILEDTERREFPPHSFISAGAIQGANMAFSRRTLELIGGFDERLGAGTPFPCEDIDAVAAALWLGIPGAYDPNPTVFHAHGRKTDAEFRSLMATYDAGRGAYYAKRILDRQSRRTYLRAWYHSIRREFQAATKLAKAGRIHTMGQSRRELISGIRFWLSLVRHRARPSHI